MRNNWVRIPLTILLVWLGWTGFKQGIKGFSDDRDWSDDYLRSHAVIVDSERRSTMKSTSRTFTSYWCELIVEYQFEGKRYRAKPLWLDLPLAKHYPKEDCGARHYGEEVPVWIGKSGNEPMLLQPGNRSSKPMTLAFNLAQGVLFMTLAGLLWLRKKQAAHD